MDKDKEILELNKNVSKIAEQIKQLELHFINHLHNHSTDRIINVALFISTIAMFIILKYH